MRGLKRDPLCLRCRWRPCRSSGTGGGDGTGGLRTKSPRLAGLAGTLGLCSLARTPPRTSWRAEIRSGPASRVEVPYRRGGREAPGVRAPLEMRWRLYSGGFAGLWRLNTFQRLILLCCINGDFALQHRWGSKPSTLDASFLRWRFFSGLQASTPRPQRVFVAVLVVHATFSLDELPAHESFPTCVLRKSCVRAWVLFPNSIATYVLSCDLGGFQVSPQSGTRRGFC